VNASVAILVSLAVSLLPSPAAQQPTWPLLVDSFPRLDTTRRVPLPSGRWLYRANITLRFKENVSDSTKIRFFNRHRMTVVGVTRSGKFFVGIPDPGPTLDSLMGRLRRLNTEPEIPFAASLKFVAAGAGSGAPTRCGRAGSRFPLPLAPRGELRSQGPGTHGYSRLLGVERMVEARHRGPSAGGPRTIGRFSPGDGGSCWTRNSAEHGLRGECGVRSPGGCNSSGTCPSVVTGRWPLHGWNGCDVSC